MCGISPERLPTLFDAFDQGATGHEARAGLGLGLFIVKQLVELHDGSVTVASEGAGQGAVFSVQLPLRASDVPDATTSQVELPDPGEALQGLTVLIVEDDDDTRDLLSTVLRLRGAEVAVAPDAGGAIVLFEARRIDVLITDIDLAGDDGHALFARLRRLTPDLRAIAVSGFATQRDVERAQTAGFDSFVAKPVTPDRLLAEVRRVAALRRHERFVISSITTRVSAGRSPSAGMHRAANLIALSLALLKGCATTMSANGFPPATVSSSAFQSSGCEPRAGQISSRTRPSTSAPTTNVSKKVLFTHVIRSCSSSSIST